MSSSSKKKETEDAIKRKFAQLFNQLTVGCGNVACTNSDCASASSGSTGMGKQAAVQRALVLIKAQAAPCPFVPGAKAEKAEEKGSTGLEAPTAALSVGLLAQAHTGPVVVRKSWVSASDSDGRRPTSTGLDTMDQLNAWLDRADPDPFNVATTPLRGRRDEGGPRLLVCHDMMGGYCQDRFPQGDSTSDIYRIYAWHLIDVFVYFSHKFITIPTPTWTNVAHRNGAKVLGTVITEHQAGYQITETVLSSVYAAEQFAQDLCRLAVYYRFDGWLINIENPLSARAILNLPAFLTKLTALMHQLVPGSLVIWYDSVCTDGQLAFQNMLNERNSPYFDATDGIFLNYWWSPQHLQGSAAMAQQQRHRDIYVGIDVFGRNTYGGGGWNCDKALQVINQHQMSTALFAPGWVYENLGTANFEVNQARFWGVIQKYCASRALQGTHLSTSFDRGFGEALFVDGHPSLPGPWSCLSGQCLLPDSTSPQASLSGAVAFTGGSSLKLDGAGGVIKLFSTDLKLKGPVVLHFTHSKSTPPDLCVVLELAGGPEGAPARVLLGAPGAGAGLEPDGKIDENLKKKYGVVRSASLPGAGGGVQFAPCADPAALPYFAAHTQTLGWGARSYLLCERYLRGCVVSSIGLRWTGQASFYLGSLRLVPLSMAAPPASALAVEGLCGEGVEWHLPGRGSLVIQVGGSGSKTKTLTLPEDDLEVDGAPLNWQDPGWSDRFSARVEGRTLTVTRTDASSGWGQDLQMRARRTVKPGVPQQLSVSMSVRWTSSPAVEFCHVYRRRDHRYELLGKAYVDRYRLFRLPVSMLKPLSSPKGVVEVVVQAVTAAGAKLPVVECPLLRLQYESA